MGYQKYKEKTASYILDRNLSNEPLLIRLPWRLIQVGYAVIRDLADGQLSLRAMSLVYTTLITIVPLLAISFSVLKGFGVHNQIEPTLLNLMKPLGAEKSAEVASKIIEFVDHIKVGVLGAVGLGLLIFAVISMMQKIEHAFNFVWRNTKTRSFAERFSDYLSVLLLGPLLIFISAGITTTLRNADLIQAISEMPGMNIVFDWVGLLIPWFIMAGGFTFFYLYMPNTKVKISAAFVGGLFAAALWKIMGYGFTTLIASSSSYVAIYTAFASVIIFMIWMYLAWLVVLMGASVAFYVQYPKYMRVNRYAARLSSRMKERLSISIMYLIGKASYAEKTEECSSDKLSQDLKIPPAVVEAVLADMKEADLVTETRDVPPRWIASTPFDSLSVNDVFSRMARVGDHALSIDDELVIPKPAKDILQQHKAEMEDAFGKQSLKSMLDSTKKQLK